MNSRTRIRFFKSFSIIHKGFSFGLSGWASRSCIFIFQMWLISPRSWNLRKLFCYKISYFFSAGIPSIFTFVFFNKSSFVISGWSRSLLSLLKICFSKFRANFASRVIEGGIVSSWGTHIVIGSWSFLSFGEIFSIRAANESAMFIDEISLGFILGRAWFISVVIEVNVFGWFAFVAKGKYWSFVENFCSLYLVILRSWRLFIIVDEFETHRSFRSFLSQIKSTVMYDLGS